MLILTLTDTVALQNSGISIQTGDGGEADSLVTIDLQDSGMLFLVAAALGLPRLFSVLPDIIF